MPPTVYLQLLQVGHVKISQNSIARLPKTQLFSNAVLISVEFSPASEQEHVLLPSTSFSPFSVAIGAQHSAMPHHWNNDVLASIFPPPKTKQVTYHRGC